MEFIIILFSCRWVISETAAVLNITSKHTISYLTNLSHQAKMFIDMQPKMKWLSKVEGSCKCLGMILHFGGTCICCVDWTHCCIVISLIWPFMWLNGIWCPFRREMVECSQSLLICAIWLHRLASLSLFFIYISFGVFQCAPRMMNLKQITNNFLPLPVRVLVAHCDGRKRESWIVGDN